MKKTIAVAMAVIMAFSCVTVVTAADVSDAETDLPVGGAVGMKGDVSVDSVMELINTAMKEIDPEWEPVTKEVLVEKLKTLLAKQGVTLESMDFDASGSVAAMAEVVDSNVNGTTIRMQAGADVRFTLDFNITAPENLQMKDFVAVTALTMDGYLFLDSENRLAGYNMTVNLATAVSGEHNMDGILQGVGAENDLKQFHLNAGISMSMSTSFIDPVKFMTDREEEWDVETDSSNKVKATVTLDTTMTEFIDERPKSIQESSQVYTDYIDLTFTSVKSGDGYEISIIDHFGFNNYPSYMCPPDYSQIPQNMLVNGSPYLDDSGKNTVRDAIAAINTDANIEITDAQVDFYDDDWNLSETVIDDIGKTLQLPGEPAPAEPGTVFLGWEDWNTNRILNGEITLTCDLDLHPVYGKVTDTKPTGPSDGPVIWVTDADGVKDQVLEKGTVADYEWLKVSVKDGDRVLYNWTFGYDFDPASVIKPEILETDIPGADYIKSVADGRDSMYLDFKASGLLPSDTFVDYNVGDKYADGSLITIYRDDGTGLTYADSGIVQDGILTITPGHCTGFLLVAGTPGEDSGSDSNTLLYVGIAAVLVIVLVAAVVLVKRSH